MAAQRGKARQSDIALSAGVSQTTVSLVLSGRVDGPVTISEETRAKVLRAAAKLGYSPNIAAQRLAGGRTGLIGVYSFEPIFRSPNSWVYLPLLMGIEKEAEERGLDLVIFTSRSDDTTASRIYSEGRNRMGLVDGSILLGRHGDTTELARLARESFPFVYFGRRSPAGADINWVSTDYTTGTKRVAEQVLAKGHRTLKYIGLADNLEPEDDREEGFRLAMKATGLAAEVERIEPTEITASWLARQFRNGVTALILESPALAQRLPEVAKEAQVSIPAELSVAVLGDLDHTEGDGVSWTGFSLDLQLLCGRVVEELVRVIANPHAPAEHVLLPCTPVDGGTVAARYP
ncbi:MAG: LacI family transcriptional regulator [Bifidobacteriaceae bacterium]|nr:LacI family transcriptional regulator [Bifidobacteriaceae bacterium]